MRIFSPTAPIDRRAFLTAAGGAFLAGLAPRAAAALASTDAVYASAYLDGYQNFGVALLAEDGTVLHRYDLPERGHDAVFSPDGETLVVFARRPGTFAAAIDMRRESEPLIIHAPEGRHYYGHGCFSPDGKLLFSTENDYDNARGTIGIYDATDGFRRIGEFFSGGIGPHDMTVLPDGRTMLIANGGLETHPDYGRAVLNVATMKPNLAFVDLADYSVLSAHELAPDLHKLSIRHLAMMDDGTTWFATQNQGDIHQPLPLAGSISPDGEVRLLDLPEDDLRLMRGYIGSVAFNDRSGSVVFTSPQGNVAFEVKCDTGAICNRVDLPDICGAVERGAGFLLSSGMGMLDGHKTDLSWDNHIARRTV